jgi:CheY-like chemotaxis protein
LLNDSVQLNLMRLGSKPIEFAVLVDEKIPATLLGDVLRIKQILNNLLSNAFKYTATGSVEFEVSFDEPQSKLVLCVKDTGQGMSKEQLAKLFDEYSRFNSESNASVEGAGLGLAITQRLLLLMGGEVHVESEPGVGSTFTVKIPQKVVGDVQIGAETAENLRYFRVNNASHNIRGQISRESMPYGSVLVVDDVETNLYVAIGLLRPYDLRVDTASSGKEAFSKIESGNSYDVVFMDHMMPGIDGITATKMIREFGYTKPIVALSANAVVGQAEIFLDNGFDDFVSKPIDVRQLNAVLNKFVRDSERLETVSDFGSEQLGESEESRSVDGLDIKKGLSKFSGDKAIYYRILRSYTASMREIIAELCAFGTVGDANLEDFRRNVHSVKGTSYDIFADDTGKVAESLENAAKNGDFEFINAQCDKFIESLQKLVADLEAFLAEVSSEQQKPKKDRPEKEVLERLLVACKTYDMDGADAAADRLNEFEYENDGELAEWLCEKTSLMKFDEIVAKLSEK